jgi:hypothetical protein
MTEKINPNDWDPPLFDNEDHDNPLSMPRPDDIPDEILAEMHPDDLEFMATYWKVIDELIAERESDDDSKSK